MIYCCARSKFCDVLSSYNASKYKREVRVKERIMPRRERIKRQENVLEVSGKMMLLNALAFIVVVINRGRGERRERREREEKKRERRG